MSPRLTSCGTGRHKKEKLCSEGEGNIRVQVESHEGGLTEGAEGAQRPGDLFMDAES